MSNLTEIIAIVHAQRETLSRATEGLSLSVDYYAYRAAQRTAGDRVLHCLQGIGGVIHDDWRGHSIRLAGIRSSSTNGLQGALDNWLRKASAKAILSGEHRL